MRFLAVVLIWLAFGAQAALAGEARDHYYWRPALSDGASRPWAVLLPGSGGLSILGDEQHYFRAAQWLNEAGLDALVVDYHNAAEHVTDARDGEAGDRIAAVVADALGVVRSQGFAMRGCPGFAVGWSLGSEGVWALSEEGGRDLGIGAGVVFYPTTRRPLPSRLALDVLALQGEADNVTPLAELRAFQERVDGRDHLNVVVYPQAEHGFDVESLERPRIIRFPPLVGQRATFAFQAEAAGQARQAALSFLNDHGAQGGCIPEAN